MIIKQNSFQIIAILFLSFIVIGFQLQGCVGVTGDEYKKCTKDWNSVNPELDRIIFLKDVKVNCTPSPDCAGANCTGHGLSHSFILNITIEHCTNPIKITLNVIINPGRFHRNLILKDNTPTTVLEKGELQQLFPVQLKVTPIIKRNNSNITVKASICVTVYMPTKLLPIPIKTTCFTIGNGLTLPVNQKTCLSTTATPLVQSTKPGDVATTASRVVTSTSESTGVAVTTKSAVVTSTATKQKLGTTSTDHHTSTPTPSQSSEISTSKGTVSTEKPTTANNTPNTSSKTPVTTKASTQNTQSTSKHSYTKAKRHHRKKDKSSEDSGLSTGGKVAISVSLLLIAIVGVGLFAYWRRLRQRRPAYYNDISINSPTDRDDVDDDEEPLFNSHLVL